MARNSTKKPTNRLPEAPRKFSNEKEEADWLASPAGRRFTERRMQVALREGRVVVHRGGDGSVQKTDPAVLQRLLEEARASMTKAVSLRIPESDLDEARRIAKTKGIGYQTVLKQIIHEGLRHAG